MSDIQDATVPKAVEELNFEKGLPGFHHLTRFNIEQSNPDAPFAVLQSLEEEQVWFLIGNPFAFYLDYEFELSPDAKLELEIEDADELAVWGIITYKGSINDSTMNLQAPVVINRMKGKGKQVILNDSCYSIRHPLALKPNEGGDSDAGA